MLNWQMEKSEQNSLSLEQKAIQNCEDEPIHNIGYIQPFGFLLAIDPEDFIITSVSENIVDWFDLPISEILGVHVDKFFSKEILHQCNNALSHSTIDTQREFVGRLKKENTFCEVFAHLKQKRFIFELHPECGPESRHQKLLDNVQRLLDRLSKITDVQSLMEQASHELRFLSGFHRVKTYKFLSDGAGEVVAESREQQVDSFLGLRFPAFDIPNSARKLYVTTPIRILPSIGAKQVPILSQDSNAEELDLSLAILRGLVPVHSMYLQNMGVKASLSLPIVLDGKMWGLFAFHHEEERMLNSETLTSLEILGSAIAMTLATILQKQRLANLKDCTRVASILFVTDESPLGYSAYWDSARSELATLVSSQGVSLTSESKVHTYGICPDTDTIRLLAKKLQEDFATEEKNTKPIAIESISARYPDLDCGEIAGFLAIPKPATPFDFLFYFRKSADGIVRWAGNPIKNIEKTYEGVRLNPRASFTEYSIANQKQSDKFSDEEHLIGESLKDALIKVTANSVVQSEHRKRLGLVIRELNHRVRNTLALVSSIVTQTSSSSHTIEEYIKSLEIRILSLSETQKLLTEFEWREVGIQKLFERSLLPYKAKLDKQIILEGPNVKLQPALASLLSLIINELALNASKYGALVNANGTIELSWEIMPGKVTISWIEKGGPEVQTPTREGFGTTLIKEALTYEFGAVCSLDYLKEGIEAKFIIPFESDPVVDHNIATRIESVPKENKTFTALVLEDDFIISRKIVTILEELGAIRIDTAPNLEVVTRYIEENEYDIAFLDVNIHGEFSDGIGKLLVEKGTPFAFVTGYGGLDENLNKIASLAVLSKPVNQEELAHVLKLAKLR